MKKIVALFLTLALMLSCVSALADGITLKVGFSEAETSQTAQVFKGIIERVAERTEGRVTLEPYYSNALGSINDSIEQISMGGNIIVSTSSEAWAAYGNYDLNALNMMYVFGSTDEVAAFNESALWKEMTDKLAAEGGIQLLCIGDAANDTIASGAYPYRQPFYAVIRADAAPDSPERKLFDWLKTPEGRALVEAAGYVAAQAG